MAFFYMQSKKIQQVPFNEKITAVGLRKLYLNISWKNGTDDSACHLLVCPGAGH